MHSLRYEDLIERPREEAARVFEFLDVSRDPAVIETVVATTSFEAQSGRQRGQEDAASFLRKGVVGDWQTSFSGPTLQVMNEVCGDLMRRFGYA